MAGGTRASPFPAAAAAAVTAVLDLFNKITDERKRGKKEGEKKRKKEIRERVNTAFLTGDRYLSK